MTALTELLAKKAELDAKIEQTRQAELQDAIAKVRELIADFNLAVSDIFPAGKRNAKKGKRGRPPKAEARNNQKAKIRHKRGKVAPKYRDPETGVTWTGRGRPPRWIDGKKKENFLI